jgi:filamentous hemagglutinin family protein
MQRCAYFIAALGCALPVATYAAPPLPLPAGGQFTAGSGKITNGAQSVTIDQTSQRGVIDWRSFSIGQANTVSFNNGSGATLNRVTGGDPSAIFGTLKGTGSVYVINPQGVLVGQSGVVSTGGRFVASALDVTNDAFMKGGALSFANGGDGAVVNMGTIGSSGGDVLLIARSKVSNEGTINAPKGTAELAAGSQVMLQDSAGNKQVFVDAGSGGAISNAGAISAAQVSLQAADGNVYALAGNHSTIRATGTATRDGHVWLVADKGHVQIHDSVAATNADGSGGTVDSTGTTLNIGNSTVSAGQWNLSVPVSYTIDQTTASALSASLNKGTSIDMTTTGPTASLVLNGTIDWNSAAALTLAAGRNLGVTKSGALRNTNAGDLVLRADSGGIDNGGSVVNLGTLDWSRSMGTVSFLFDMNGNVTPGVPAFNSQWTAQPLSGRPAQVAWFRLVNNAADLMKIGQHPDYSYALGKDIDLKSAKPATGALLAPTTTQAFTGQFDGFNHVISNMNISVPTNASPPFVGLFGVIGATGSVRRVGLANATIDGGYSGTDGALAGRNDGHIAYAWSTGSVGSGESFAGVGGGGLVGLNKGTIERSWSGAAVGGEGSYGGLAYENDGRIAQSYATGDIRTIGTHESGAGLVYTNIGTISQSYSTGRVDTLIGDGAFVGQNGGVIEESFFAGKAGQTSSLDAYGAIASYNQGTIRNNVYWDKISSNHMNAVTDNSFNGTAPSSANGLTTAQMGDPASFVSWNFGPSGAWIMPSGATHPVLRWQEAQH